LERPVAGSSGKLIWALEAYHRFERLKCSECGEKAKRKRVCRAWGNDYPEGEAVYRCSSPALADNPELAILYECPVGLVQREAPYVYDVINAHSLSEGAGLALLEQPRWLQLAFRVIGSEQGRHREAERREQQAKTDARYGARVLKGR